MQFVRDASCSSATSRPGYSPSTYCVGEIVLKREFRGRGLGPAVQRGLAERLGDRRGEVLHGSIGAVNKPALKTARKCGQVDIGGDYWIPIPS